MHLAGLWRYPIKSLAGEPLVTARLTEDGIDGDRVVHVSSGSGPLTARTRHQLVTVPATTDNDGTPLVAGHRWDSPEADRIVRTAAGDDARLVAFDGPERFDVLELLVATDGAVDAFGHDLRRLRPNLLIGGVPGRAETEWPGHALVIGDVLIGVHSLRPRCVVTSIDPDTGDRNSGVFRHIHRDFGGELALNCWVIRPGTLQLGAAVELVPTSEQPARVGGWIVGAPYTPTG
jgi:uncharacterized protein YcbX